MTERITTRSLSTADDVTALFLTADGEEIDQDWQPAFVAYAFLVAFAASYVAVHLLDHSLWRTDDEREHAIITKPRTTAAVLLGFGTVWCMHFIGMAAVTLPDRPICYDWGITIGSLLAAVVFMIAGLQVSSNDIFATPNRVQVLKDILIHRHEVTHRRYTKKAMREIFRVTCLEQLHYIFGGSFLAASGATVMHYTGMMAMHGAFELEWRPWWIVGSSIYAVVVCFVGFWIIFRLRWKVKDQWLRVLSAAIIAAAVCGLHFGGMLSVHYIADNFSGDVCQETFDQHNTSPNAWTTHQLLVVAMAITVPLISVIVENAITQELILTHGANKDKAFARLVRKLEGSGGSSSGIRDSTLNQTTVGNAGTMSSIRMASSMQRLSSANFASSGGFPSVELEEEDDAGDNSTSEEKKSKNNKYTKLLMQSNNHDGCGVEQAPETIAEEEEEEDDDTRKKDIDIEKQNDDDTERFVQDDDFDNK